MELKQASLFFDKTPVCDVTSGVELFRGQIKPYDESHRDNASAYRRILSISPDLKNSVPPCVQIFSEAWMVGSQQSDGWSDQHRVKFIIQRSEGSVTGFTPSGMLTGTPAFSTQGSLSWAADRRELEVSSYVPQDYIAYLPSDSSVTADMFLVQNGKSIYVESVYTSAAGLVEAKGRLQKSSSSKVCNITSRTFSQSAGKFVSQATSSSMCIEMRWQDHYRYIAQTDERYQEGDAVFMVPTGAPVVSGALLVVGGVSWAALQSRTDNGVQEVHARRA